MSQRPLWRSMGLLGLACLPGCWTPPDSPSAAAPAVVASAIQFDDGRTASGIDFVHRAGRTDRKSMPEIMGAGVAIADFNRDGAPDVLLINGGELGNATRPANAGNRLYINNGQGQFDDATERWGLGSHGYGMGVAIGDYDNDGFPDVFLSHFAGDDRLLRNSGTGFQDVTLQAGIVNDGQWSTSAGFFDYDNDGDLDLYVVRYIKFSLIDAPQSFRNRILTYPTPLLFDGVADRLLRNDGGTFVDVSGEMGLTAAPGKGLALALGDLDLNGVAEVYVANDTAANQLWLTASEGPWQEIAQLSGAAYNQYGGEEGSMGADFSDTDDNGLPDIAVSNFQLEVTSLYRQDAPLLFTELSDRLGIGRSSRERLSFGLDFFDADNDGDEDLLVANGHVEDNIHLNSDSVSFAQRNSLYENGGDGRFDDISARSGTALAQIDVSRGLATGDLNGDGALDFVISNNDGAVEVGFNRSASRGHFVILWLEGRNANRSAIGARVVATIQGREIQRQVMGAQSYLSVSDFRLHFGLGDAEQIDQLSIHWPGGDVQQIDALAGDGFYYVLQGAAPETYVPGQRVIDPPGGDSPP